MAIRVKEIIYPDKLDSSPTPINLDLALKDVDLGRSQRLVAFKEGSGIGGFIHTGPPDEKYTNIVPVLRGEETRAVMTNPKGVVFVVEGY